jgi:hypothetical protein
MEEILKKDRELETKELEIEQKNQEMMAKLVYVTRKRSNPK